MSSREILAQSFSATLGLHGGDDAFEQDHVETAGSSHSRVFSRAIENLRAAHEQELAELRRSFETERSLLGRGLKAASEQISHEKLSINFDATEESSPESLVNRNSNRQHSCVTQRSETASTRNATNSFRKTVGLVRSQTKAAKLLGFKRQKTSEIQIWCKLQLHTHREPPDTWLSRVVSSWLFEFCVCGLIVANAVVMARAANVMMEHLGDGHKDEFGENVEIMFCLIYALELTIRVVAHRWHYFLGPNSWWNFYDIVLVSLALYDQVVRSSTENVSILRTLRLLKMARLLRMVRLMRMFRELRLIVSSILGSLKPMLWSLLLIIAMIYIFGVLFLQAEASYLVDSAPSDDERTAIYRWWGSVSKAMLSLYMAGTGGEDWGSIAEPLQKAGSTFYLLFLVYIAFFQIVMMNTVTSLFIVGTQECSEKDQQFVIHEELHRKQIYVDKLQNLFSKLDAQQTGAVSYDAFQQSLDDPEMLAFCSSLDIEALDVDLFFNVLSSNGRRSVDLETFVVGCIKLRGLAKSMDLIELICMHRNLQAKQDRLNLCCEKEFAQLRLLFKRNESLLKRNEALKDYVFECDSRADVYRCVKTEQTLEAI